MISEPWFWRDDSAIARLVRSTLAPASSLYSLGQKQRIKRTKPYRPKVPTVCIGNASLGGVGKTPTALAIADILSKSSDPVFLTRGYGGAFKGPIDVNPHQHSAQEVGDEALLLARRARTVLAKSKSAGAKLAESNPNGIIIMDDGFQNPTVVKDFTLLLIGETDVDPHLSLFPAGPMRESLDEAIKRADALGLVGNTELPIKRTQNKPTFSMKMHPAGNITPERVLAFCAIGNPDRFFNMLAHEGYDVAESVALPDHSTISDTTINALQERASNLNARLITTEKDSVRLSPENRDGISIFRAKMKIENQSKLIDLIINRIKEPRS